MDYIICCVGIILLDISVIGYFLRWCLKMKKEGYRFHYVAPVWRAIIDMLMLLIIIVSEIYYVVADDKKMLVLVVIFFCVYILPPRRYVFWGKRGVYVGTTYFTTEEQLEGQAVRDYPFHRGKVKVYAIQTERKRSELVLLSTKKIDLMWR